jgi:hypothetical protein
MVNLAHHKLAAAAEWFGAKWLMAFNLGETRVIMTCNLDVTKEILNSSVACCSTTGYEFFFVCDVLKRASLSNMMCSVFGKNYETVELGELMQEGYELLGKLNWSDHLPWLAGLDLQKIKSDHLSMKMEIIGTQFGVKTLAKMASFWLMFSYVYFFPLEGILVTCNLKTM